MIAKILWFFMIIKCTCATRHLKENETLSDFYDAPFFESFCDLAEKVCSQDECHLLNGPLNKLTWIINLTYPTECVEVYQRDDFFMDTIICRNITQFVSICGFDEVNDVAEDATKENNNDTGTDNNLMLAFLWLTGATTILLTLVAATIFVLFKRKIKWGSYSISFMGGNNLVTQDKKGERASATF